MSKIIDFEEEAKRRLEEKKKKEEEENFFKRFRECEQRVKDNGVCDCDVCAVKAEMTDKLLVIAADLAVEYMKTTGQTLYYGDLLEVMATATIKLKAYCQTDMEEDEDDGDDDSEPPTPTDEPTK